MKTEDNKCCAFPFVYRGTTYNACNWRRGRKPWCSLSPSYDMDRKYGYCKGMEAKINGDDQVFIYVNGRFIGVDNGKWKIPTSFYFPASLQIIGIYVKNRGGNAGFIASFGNGLVSDASWKCTTQNIRNWPTASFDDKNWPAAVVYSSNSGAAKVNGIASDAKWIGTRQRNVKGFFCRRLMTISGDLPVVEGSCDKPLGLQNGWVQNSQMTASSVWTKTHAAWRGRLFTPKQYSFPGAWCSRYINTNQWIQVAFYRPVDVTAIATQGRPNYNQWVTSFTLSYSEDGTKFTVYSVGGQQKVFRGNNDRNTVVKHSLVPKIGARFIKVHPKTWYGHISMRMELYGCLMDNHCQGISRGNLVLLVITDGQATGGINTIKAPIKLLKDSSVNIISVGVGKGTGINELRFMASSPTSSHLFSVENTNQLGNLIGSITASSCTSYNCRYVTCDYSQWSEWSVSCGIRMRRTRRLVKVNEKYIKQQGGCSGLQLKCNNEETETKNMNCPCISVTCSWSSWGSWSSTCGRMTRQRVSNAKQSIIHRPNCIGLQTSCPLPEAQSIYISCCKGELGILIDESGSIGGKDFEGEKGFVTALANGFSNFGPNGIQMAVITYSTNAQLDIKLDQYSNKQEFINAVKRIRYQGSAGHHRWTGNGRH
ncbi:PREDICTED: uncharacterized protein LOC107342725 [Acropora digitifera]|uniref:uncharacterized protein LOC107342725 n=1 Tax=Acropora digitifera TaxID=70779 RepID=UPI00077A5636|nr:PREDICTED: uncharacterized protein LOC107342725 [Acropora digitifera]